MQLTVIRQLRMINIYILGPILDDLDEELVGVDGVLRVDAEVGDSLKVFPVQAVQNLLNSKLFIFKESGGNVT